MNSHSIFFLVIAPIILQPIDIATYIFISSVMGTIFVFSVNFSILSAVTKIYCDIVNNYGNIHSSLISLIILQLCLLTFTSSGLCLIGLYNFVCESRSLNFINDLAYHLSIIFMCMHDLLNYLLIKPPLLGVYIGRNM